MNGVLLWIAGLVAVLLAALFTVPYAIDWNSYRGVFEEEASRVLGREVRMGGDVNVRLLPAPYISFEKPRIADEGIGEAFFRAESFTMWLALPPLVQGIFEARQIELKRPILRLRIDADGGGNWQKFRLARGALPFVPRGVSLKSVRISDGVVAVHGVNGEPLTRLEIAEAELAAPALEGPYKLRADIQWGGDMIEVRGSTAAPDADESVRLKLSARARGAGVAYTLDGRLADLGRHPRFEGDVTATVPGLPTASLAPPNGPGSPPFPEAAGRPGAYEIRAGLAANAVGARLGDIAFSFERDGKPQLLTGSAEASWRGRTILKASLASRWLDIDRIAALPAGASAFDTLRRLSAGLIAYLPAQGEVSARIAVDQATIAGDMVSDLVMALRDAGHGLEIEELSASLPGGSRLEVSGARVQGGSAEGFEGDVLLRGAHFGRFLAWTARGLPFAQAKVDSSFALSTRLSLGHGRLELREARIEAGGNRLAGEMSYSWEGRKRLVLTGETAQADLSAVFPGALHPESLRALLSLGIAGPADGLQAAGAPALPPVHAGLDARVRLRAGVLTDGRRALHDIDADLSLESGLLSIESLKAATPAGFKIEIGGELRNQGRQPSGTLQGVVSAASPKAIAEMLDFSAIDMDAARARWLGALAPSRLAFTTRLGRGGRPSAEISIDGMVLGEPLTASLVLDGGVDGWREAPLDAMLVSDSTEVARIARGFALASPDGQEREPGSRRGRLLVKAVGTPARDVAALFQVSSEDLQLVLRGRGSAPADNAALRFKGELEVAAGDSGRVLRLAGWHPPAGAAGIGCNGTIGISLTDARLVIDFGRLELGGARIAGRATVAGPTGARSVEADLKASEVSLARLAGLMLAAGAAAAPEAPNGAEPGRWQDQPFDLTSLERVRGRVAVHTDALTLEEGFSLAGATLEVELAPGLVTVSKLEGQALGGAMSAAFKLQKAPAGATLSGALGLFDIRLEQIGGADDAPLASGRAQLTAQFSGQALTPRALVSVLSGKGELELKAARFERLSPAAIGATAEAVLTGRVASAAETVRRALRKALAEAPLTIGSRKAPVGIGEGALRIGAITVEAPGVLATNRTTIDLGEMKIDSEWKIEPNHAANSRSAPLPGISVVHVGPLGSFASLEPRIMADALERELAVRGMERDVEHLERLRKEDEARARAEAERQKALELQQQQMQQPLGPAPPTIDVPFPLPGTAPAATPSPQQSTVTPPPGAVPKMGEGEAIAPAPPPRPAPRRPPPSPTPSWSDQWPRPSGS